MVAILLEQLQGSSQRCGERAPRRCTFCREVGGVEQHAQPLQRESERGHGCVQLRGGLGHTHLHLHTSEETLCR